MEEINKQELDSLKIKIQNSFLDINLKKDILRKLNSNFYVKKEDINKLKKYSLDLLLIFAFIYYYISKDIINFYIKTKDKNYCYNMLFNFLKTIFSFKQFDLTFIRKLFNEDLNTFIIKTFDKNLLLLFLLSFFYKIETNDVSMQIIQFRKFLIDNIYKEDLYFFLLGKKYKHSKSSNPNIKSYMEYLVEELLSKNNKYESEEIFDELFNEIYDQMFFPKWLENSKVDFSIFFKDKYKNIIKIGKFDEYKDTYDYKEFLEEIKIFLEDIYIDEKEEINNEDIEGYNQENLDSLGEEYNDEF